MSSLLGGKMNVILRKISRMRSRNATLASPNLAVRQGKMQAAS